MSSSPKISIVMPIKNGVPYLSDTLTMVFRQEVEYDFEVIAIDSGSTDGSLDILAGFPVRVTRIPPHEFGHGRTRNRALDLARGEIIVFLNQDATPLDHRWLHCLVRHFGVFDRLAGVYGRHLPREDCDPLMRRELLTHPVFASPLAHLRFISDEDAYRRSARDPARLPHFITVSCAVSRPVFEAHPFRQDLEFAEDLEWGIRVVEAGYGVMFDPGSAVIHSHNYYASASRTLRKNFDVYTASVHISEQPRSILRQRFWWRWFVAIAKDFVWVLRDDRGSWRFKVRWLFRIPWIRTVEFIGGALALHRDRIPRRYLKRLSLVAAIKRGGA